MPSRKRKPFIPPSWVDPTSENEWQESYIPPVMDMGNNRPQVPVQFNSHITTREQEDPQPAQFVGGVLENIVEMSEDESSGFIGFSIHSQEEPSPASDGHAEDAAPISHEEKIRSNVTVLPLEEEVEIEEDEDEVGVEDRHPAPLSHQAEQVLTNVPVLPEEVEVEIEDEIVDEEIFDSEEDSNKDEFVNFNDYKNELAEKWLVLEVSHRVSKNASNELWRLADSGFQRLYKLKGDQKVKKKVPQFAHLRKVLHKIKVPEILMEVAYKNKETDEVVILKNLKKMPLFQYPPEKYTKLYEQASVQVEDIVRIHTSKCNNIVEMYGEKTVQLSCDSVSECKSNGISIDVYSIKFTNCKHVYPLQIIRPLQKNQIDHGDRLQHSIQDLTDNACRILQYIADNLKRATAKGCLIEKQEEKPNVNKGVLRDRERKG